VEGYPVDPWVLKFTGDAFPLGNKGFPEVLEFTIAPYCF